MSHLCSLLFAAFCRLFHLSCVYQDALTDLTGDSERLPVEEQHGTWLGHKVRGYCFKPLTYNTFSRLDRLLRDFTFSSVSVLHSAISIIFQTPKVISAANSKIITEDI